MSDTEDLYMEALDQFAEENYEGAVELFQKITEQEPDNIDAYHAIARACFEGREENPGLLEAAIEAAERIVELDPDDVTAYSTLSQIYVWKGDKDTAEMWGGKARIAGWKQQLQKNKPGDSGGGI